MVKITLLKLKDNLIFQITSGENELNIINGVTDNKCNLSVINLGQCEKTLRDTYLINASIPLIVLKLENKTTNIASKDIKYEVYNSYTKEKLDLSVCNNNINILYPISLDDNKKYLYENLGQLGYDIFDIQDSFYQDICAKYTNDNGTDMLLYDRKNDIYDFDFSCPSNCRYNSYSNQTSFLSCECSIVNKNITLEDIGNIVIDSFLNVFHTLNYKFIICYKLVFHLNVITKNYGSIFTISLFILYLVFLIFYIIKGTKPLIKKADNFIKKKRKKNPNNNLSFNKEEGHYKSNQTIEKKSKKKLNNSVITNSRGNENPLLVVRSLKKKDRKEKKSDKNNKMNKNENILYNILNQKKRNKLSKFELNNLEYIKAIKYDKRTFIQTYISKLKNKHLIMFTFFANKDFNLIYIKIARFSFSVCTNLAMNVLFFFDETMHKIYLNYGDYDFIQQIPQILYSSLISQIIDILIDFLIITEKDIHKIIDLKQSNPKKNNDKIKSIIKLIKIKYILFFIISSLLFAFFWYFISAFCAVYENTQIIFLKDFITSFFTGLLYPFGIYFILAFFRVISLKDKDKKRLKFLYVIGNF